MRVYILSFVIQCENIHLMLGPIVQTNLLLFRSIFRSFTEFFFLLVFAFFLVFFFFYRSVQVFFSFYLHDNSEWRMPFLRSRNDFIVVFLPKCFYLSFRCMECDLVTILWRDNTLISDLYTKLFLKYPRFIGMRENDAKKN